ncbi:MAG: hypothetical protein AB7S75_24530 [Desulfococcaceae bacterium]
MLFYVRFLRNAQTDNAKEQEDSARELRKDVTRGLEELKQIEEIRKQILTEIKENLARKKNSG